VNDSEREDWVANDEGLYDMQRTSGRGMTAWVRENREIIDTVACKVISSEQPAHYLKYGGRPAGAARYNPPVTRTDRSLF
jgi:hypothetical protein